MPLIQVATLRSIEPQATAVALLYERLRDYINPYHIIQQILELGDIT